MYSSNIARTRYTGLSSGVDIDALVKASMQLYYTRIDAATKQKTLNEWKKEAYRDMNTKLSDFKNKYFSFSSSATNLVSSNSLQAKKASITDNNYVKVTANSTAEIEAHRITDVTVASKAEASSSKLYVESGAVGKKTLSELSEMFKAQGGSFADAADDGSYTVKLNVNGKAVEKTFSADTTVDDFMKTINSSGIDGKLSFDEISRKFELKTNETGKEQTVSISGAMFGSAEVSATGTNASVTIDGEKHESKTNSFTVGGLTFETLGNASDLDLNLSVKKDTDEAFNRIKAFVEEYNSLISDIQTKTAEIKSSYLPLTDDEKSAMEDEDIEAWTKKAKQGMFYNDSTLKTLVSKMRSIFSETYVDGVGFTKADKDTQGTNFASIGIKTGSYEMKGQIVLDEAKLREALENDSETVAKMFSGENGLSSRFSDALEATVDTIRDVKISGFTSKISSYEDKIDELYSVLETKEDALYDRYATMETTLAKLQSQMSQFGF